MTDREALRWFESKIKSAYITEEDRQAMVCAIHALEASCKTQITTYHVDMTQPWMNVPESPNDAETDDLRLKRLEKRCYYIEQQMIKEGVRQLNKIIDLEEAMKNADESLNDLNRRLIDAHSKIKVLETRR